MTRPVLNQAIAFALPSSVRPLGLFTEPTPALQASFPANRISSTVFVAIHSVLCLPSGPFANENEPSPACRFPDAHGDVGGRGSSYQTKFRLTTPHQVAGFRVHGTLEFGFIDAGSR
jgi:hypothetical protein